MTAVTVFPGEKQIVTAFFRIPEQRAGALIEGRQYGTETTDIIEIIKKIAAEILLGQRSRGTPGSFGVLRAAARAGLGRRRNKTNGRKKRISSNIRDLSFLKADEKRPKGAQ